MFQSSSLCFKAQFTPVSSPLLTVGQGHVSSIHRIPSAQSCSCGFAVLLVVDVVFEEHEGPESIYCWESLREGFFGLVNITRIKFGEVLCRSAMIKGFQKESQFPQITSFHI